MFDSQVTHPIDETINEESALTEIPLPPFTYKLQQVTEIIRRTIYFDPIKKFAFAIRDGTFFGIALRQSKNFDLYRDLLKVETPLVKAENID